MIGEVTPGPSLSMSEGKTVYIVPCLSHCLMSSLLVGPLGDKPYDTSSFSVDSVRKASVYHRHNSKGHQPMPVPRIHTSLIPHARTCT